MQPRGNYRDMTFEDLVNYTQNLENGLKAVTLTVSEMADRIDSLTALARDRSVSLASSQEDDSVDPLIRRELDAHHQRIDSNHNRLGEHQGRIDAQRANVLAMEKRLSELEQGDSAGFRQRIQALEQRISAIESGFSFDLCDRVLAIERLLGKEGASPMVTQIAKVAEQVHELDVLLFGDKDLHAKWEAGKVNFPNIPEPGPGWVELFERALDDHDKLQAGRWDSFASMLSDVTSKITFVARLEAFFGPLLAGKNPPLDGEQIASKNYVDNAMQRLSDALRSRFAEQFNEAAGLTKELLSAFAVNYGGSLVGSSVVSGFTDKIMWLLMRETNRYNEDLARVNKPSRLRAAIYAVTGKNGAP
jgi:hypothetical protein